MPTIKIRRTGERPDRFRVIVSERGSQTTHDVTFSEVDYQRLTGGEIPPEDLVRRSFEFLLEREPKESILRSFNLSVIGRYFPDWERVIRG